jgi:hypothetical protein
MKNRTDSEKDDLIVTAISHGKFLLKKANSLLKLIAFVILKKSLWQIDEKETH